MCPLPDEPDFVFAGAHVRIPGVCPFPRNVPFGDLDGGLRKAHLGQCNHYEKPKWRVLASEIPPPVWLAKKATENHTDFSRNAHRESNNIQEQPESQAD